MAYGVFTGYWDRYQDEYPPTHFPPLKEGDIFPLYGRFYRVTNLVGGGFPKRTPDNSSARMAVEWVDPATLPEAARLKLPSPPSAVVPLRPDWNNSTWIPGCCSAVLSDIGLTEDRGPEATVTLRFGKGYWAAELHAGDTVLIDGKGFRVANVVPRDEKTGVIGWVEFDTRPLAEAELKAAKAVVQPRYVRDAPRDTRPKK